MKNHCQIIVEGISDVVFIEQIIRGVLKLDCPDIIKLEGKDKLKTKIELFKNLKLATEKSNSDDTLFLIIQDADSYHEKNNPTGGYPNRKKYLTELLDHININYQLFLFPNNQNDGELEDLLIEIAQNKAVFAYFDTYQNCIQKLPLVVNSSNIKTKVYAYFTALEGEENAKLERRNYLNSQLWNLEAEGLQPLLHFLRTHLN
jgi:hypothetical protein